MFQACCQGHKESAHQPGLLRPGQLLCTPLQRGHNAEHMKHSTISLMGREPTALLRAPSLQHLHVLTPISAVQSYTAEFPTVIFKPSPFALQVCSEAGRADHSSCSSLNSKRRNSEVVSLVIEEFERTDDPSQTTPQAHQLRACYLYLRSTAAFPLERQSPGTMTCYCPLQA